MSARVYPVFESHFLPPEGLYPSDNKLLADYLETLDELAESLNVPPLSSFLRFSAQERVDFGEEDFDVEGEQELWLEEADCLTTLGALLAYLKNPENEFAVEDGEDREWLIKDIVDYTLTLEEAQKHNVRFHFTLVP